MTKHDENNDWTWTLNWGAVRDDIVIGSCPMTAADIECICEMTGISAMLSVQTDLCRHAFAIDFDSQCRYATSLGLPLVNAPMRDFDPPDQRRGLPDAVRCLYRLLNQGHRVYVHCTAGFNRSPLTVLGYLTFLECMSPQDALALIKAGRPEAEPSWEAFSGCREDLVGNCRDAIERRAWDLANQGAADSPESHWLQAEKEIIRDVFIATSSVPDLRLDPSR